MTEGIKSSLVNWIITHDVDMMNSRIVLPEGWVWSNKPSEGFYRAIYNADKKIKLVVTMQDVSLEIMKRLRRGNVKYDKLFAK